NIAFLYDDNGLVLSLTSMKVGGETEIKYPATFHVGFIQENEEQVDDMNRRLKGDGIDVPPPSWQHGSWTFYFQAPGGVTVEGPCQAACAWEAVAPQQTAVAMLFLVFGEFLVVSAAAADGIGGSAAHGSGGAS